jgi:hypothetical protein
MNLHANARTCPNSRRLLVDRFGAGWSHGACWRVGVRRVRRGLVARSSAPRRIPHKTPADRVEQIIRLRRLRMTAARIALALQMALSTVSAVLKACRAGQALVGWIHPSRLTAMSVAGRVSWST